MAPVKLMQEQPQIQPDISLAKKELGGWEQKIQLKEGLKHTINYFDNLLKEV